MEKEKSTVASWDCRNQDKGWGLSTFGVAMQLGCSG